MPKGTGAYAYRTNQVRQPQRRGGKQHDIQSMGGDTRVNDLLEVKSAQTGIGAFTQFGRRSVRTRRDPSVKSRAAIEVLDVESLN